MADKLKKYNEKRDFKKTKEPAGKTAKSGKELRFVVQKHDASRLHYDFRLEFDGVLWSWAVPKGPSYNTKDKRLAVHVEDHPFDYRNFEGTIPEDEYGGGTVMLFDEGTWEPQEDAAKGMKEGSIKMILHGTRLKGKWALVRMKPRPGEEDKNWLLIKEKDDFAANEVIIDTYDTSVRTGRTMDEIARATPKENESKRTEALEEAGEDDPSLAEAALEKIDRKKPLPFQELKPMLATLVKKIPSGAGTINELKFDGYRIVSFLENGKARLMTRNGHDWSHRMPELVETLEEWDPGNLIIDGEVVVMDRDGKSDFQALQGYFKKNTNAVPDYMLFDLMAVGDKDLRKLPLIERKAMLELLLEDAPRGLHYSFHTEGKGIFDEVCESGMEGIISKKKASPYRSSRSNDWVKVKCQKRQEFVIGGFTTTEKSSTGMSALLLGAYDGKDLIYQGRAGTGISQSDADILLKRLRKRKTSPFNSTLKERTNETITYVTPALAAEIQYAEFTDEGLLRQASFKGLREDKDVKEIVLELPDSEMDRDTEGDLMALTEPGKEESTEKGSTARKKAAERSSEASVNEPKAAEALPKKQTKETSSQSEQSSQSKDTDSYAGVKLSSPERILFPDEELRKKDVADYYWSIRELILPYLIDRPMTLIRCTDSIEGECFFQKHMTHKIQGMVTETIKDNDGDETAVMIMKDEKSLMGAVQMGAVEFHSWGSALSHLEKPDWLVFDLDPDEGMDIGKVREGVLDLKSLLDQMELDSFLKTSGGKGYHVCIPLEPHASWKTTRAFAKLIAQGMEQKWPDKYTSNMRKEKRKGRIYIDWVRNNRSSTSVSVYSLRSRKGAPISWPIRWEDLDDIAPNQVTMENYHEYLETIQGWDDFYHVQQRVNA